jgi:hypothetical protein
VWRHTVAWGRRSLPGVHGGRKFFQTGRDFSGARGSGGERQKRWPEVVLPHVVAVACFPRASPSCPRFPKAPASRGAFGNRAPSFWAKKISFRSAGGRRSGVATSRVEGKDFDGVEPEAAKREPTQGG